MPANFVYDLMVRRDTKLQFLHHNSIQIPKQRVTKIPKSTYAVKFCYKKYLFYENNHLISDFLDDNFWLTHNKIRYLEYRHWGE